MAGISLRHAPALAHHLSQGIAWLSLSKEGDNTAAISYAAFELRFAIERLAVHYWTTLLERKLEEHDLRDMESFEKLERRIYKLAGHQPEIDGHFEFTRIVLRAMEIDRPLNTPKVRKLSKYWRKCSNFCHITWPLSCDAQKIRKNAFSTLVAISKLLRDQVDSLGWLVINDAEFSSLRDNFLAHKATEDDVLAHLQQTGVWSRVEYSDGRQPHFLGVAVPPRASGGGA